MPILKAVGITKEFPGVKALRNVNFEVEAGEVHGLIGREMAAGKSNASLRYWQEIYKQDSGQILLNGENVNIDTLSNTEQEKLFKVFEEMKKKGVAVIYISHRLEEIMNICDRITVLRDGQYIDTLKVEDTNIDHLVSLMVGREVEDRYPKVYNQIGEKMLEVKNLNIHNTLHNISFNVRKERFWFIWPRRSRKNRASKGNIWSR